MSRAIGDRILKAYVTAEPDVRRWEVTAADKFMVLASACAARSLPCARLRSPAHATALAFRAADGLWDVMSNEEVGEVIVSLNDPQDAAARLVEYAFTRGSADNITVLVIDLTSKRGDAPQGAAAAGAGGAAADATPVGTYLDGKNA